MEKYRIEILKFTSADTNMIACVLAENQQIVGLKNHKPVKNKPVVWIGRRSEIEKKVFEHGNVNLVVEDLMKSFQHDHHLILDDLFKKRGHPNGIKMMSVIEEFIRAAIKNTVD